MIPIFISGVDCGSLDLFCATELSLQWTSDNNSVLEDLHPYNHTLYEDSWSVSIHHKYFIRLYMEDGTEIDYKREANLTCNYTALWNNAQYINCTGKNINLYNMVSSCGVTNLA